MINYFYDCYRILNKVYSEKAFIKQAILSTDIEEKNKSLTIKTCYGVLDKDIELSFYIKCFANKNPKLVVRTILKIAMYNLIYLNKKDYAVIDNAVELAKKLGKGAMAGFINAFLRKFIKDYDNIEYPENIEEKLSIKYSFPPFAVKELINEFGVMRTEKILVANSPKTTLVFYDVDGEKYLSEKRADFQKTVFDNVFSLNNFVRNDDYDRGVYTFQSIGSVAICDIIENCDNLLDCCAAPGGKTVRLSYKCGSVTAWDVHEHRVRLIDDYINRMRIKNVVTQLKDASVYDKVYDENFDAVLCDAPCSGLGVTGDNPDIKLNRTVDDIEKLNTLQFKILTCVCNYVKKGGYLYYSTCSILEKENIQIVKQFLTKDNRFIICDINSKLPHENIEGANAFLPDISEGIGFFVAKMKRVR